MMNTAVFGALQQSGPYQQLTSHIRGGQLPCSAFGLCDGEKAYLLAGLLVHKQRPLVIVCASEIRAGRLAQDIAGLTGQEVPVFPARPVSLRAVSAASRDFMQRRLQVMAQLHAGGVSAVIVTAEALLQPLVRPEVFSGSVLHLQAQKELSVRALIVELSQAGYARQDRAENAGQFAVRGGIVDVVPYGEEQGYRIEFFGDEIDSVRRYDPFTQRSDHYCDAADIFPASEVPLDDEAVQRGIRAVQNDLEPTLKKIAKLRLEKDPKAAAEALRAGVEDKINALLTAGTFEGIENHLSVLYPRTASIGDYLDDPLIVMEEPARIRESVEIYQKEFAVEFEEALQKGQALLYQLQGVYAWEEILERLGPNRMLTVQDLEYESDVKPLHTLWFSGREITPYRGAYNRLAEDVRAWRRNHFRVIALTGSEGRAQRLSAAMTDLGSAMFVLEKDRDVVEGEAVALPVGLRQGFEDPEQRLVILGEVEVFGTSRTKRRVVRQKGKSTMDLFADLQTGDFVVHEAQGIGVFRGIVKMTADGQTRDYMQIEYLKGDMLYVPTEQMNRVEKYIGSEGRPPRVNRLGGAEWDRIKSKVRAQVKIMAEDLIKLYAARHKTKGFAYSPDNAQMREFEENFPYEETPDQASAIADIKKDMESGQVMDRLLCGDVGYGKTEVALRAAFKAICDGKQVAILVPTTVLAYQHYNTVGQRFEHFGIRYDMLCRFRTPLQQKQALKDLADGKLNLIIGTHRLLSKDVHFSNLGLLIIDEEQRFGVAHKEKIKHLKTNIDVLTMTATPIPRTLHMSMSGIRDISIIETPPEERQPVQTYVLEYQDDLVRDAIMKEIARGGQVYFLYNRVESMPVFLHRLQELVPEARITCGHGQMASAELEKVMLDFYSGEYDVLLSTTIIENGLDIPRANTLLVYDADHFGLAQLYQLRGRVGRSNRLAYAYFMYRPSKAISEIAEKRLTAIREFTEFGSGFKIAMRDLEIRGSGNLLGAEQHGNMASVGYALYCRLIDDAVRRMSGEDVVEEIDAVLEVKVDAHIPDEYIPDMAGRLEVYRRISAIPDESYRSDVIDELVDRYGEPPRPVLRLIDVVLLKNAAAAAQIESVQQKGRKVLMKFVKDAPIDPVKLLELVAQERGRTALSAGDPPALTLSLPGDRWEDLYQRTMELLAKIMLCKYGIN
ncbi:MAG: transcription-repair coupling factor [Eubacteriales bacterium]|nr:transcription-repair coupling factor [Eubacteriales bacterium]